jgi:hypothetical protein
MGVLPGRSLIGYYRRHVYDPPRMDARNRLRFRTIAIARCGRDCAVLSSIAETRGGSVLKRNTADPARPESRYPRSG